MSNNNFLSIVYVYRDDDFDQGDGLRNLSFSINNIFENIKRNNLLSAIKIYLVEWGANLEKPITRKLFLKDEFIHSLVYVPILSKDYEEKNFFNTCIAMNALIRRCESDFFLTCVGRTFFNNVFNKFEAMSASVKINESIVPRFGDIIPAPLATPASFIILLPMVISSYANLGFVSVVIIADAVFIQINLF